MAIMAIMRNKKRAPVLLNKRISIITQIETDDGMGGVTVEDDLFFSTWAAIWPVRAKEIRENMRGEVNISHNIRIRYRAGILHTMTVLFGTRSFEIKGVINPDEGDRWLDMVCNERL
jgi:SPP1 family predicted phage head-tail adaptor